MPFELGRPLGIPGDAVFQQRVLRACLNLLEADEGPVLEDYPEDAPAVVSADDATACPISFARPQIALSGSDAIAATLLAEIRRLQPWYDRRVTELGRTTFGSSTLSIEDIAGAIAGVFSDRLPSGPIPNLSLSDGLRLAVEDLKAFYTEALLAQPGATANDALVRWFWEETAAGRILLDMREICVKADDEGLKLFANAFLVPRSQTDRASAMTKPIT